jgi:Domain of unknown function (DUF5615)
MENRVRFYLDEHVPIAVAEGLKRRGIAVVTTAEADMTPADDPAQLEYAQKEGCVLVTHDADFLRLHGRDVPHAGIAYCHRGARTPGEIIRSLLLIYEQLTAEAISGRVEFL